LTRKLQATLLTQEHKHCCPQSGSSIVLTAACCTSSTPYAEDIAIIRQQTKPCSTATHTLTVGGAI
jgi:hypothetical protein